ncbi:DUF6153 family protein [Streptomyces capparidis]
MIRIGQLAGPRPRRPRSSGLLVLALLVGLIGMHGLSPAATAASEHRGGADVVMTGTVVTPAQHDGCDEHGHDCDGHGGADHADQTCASGAVPGGPALPALLPALTRPVIEPEAVRAPVVHAPDGGRAPPSLAELQLLRI